jgi:broad specificity phosphatase PhoE
LLRHGETDWNAERRIQGVSDQPLNAVGIAKAKALIPPLEGRPIAAVYSSALSRARETAEILAKGLGGLPVREDGRLAELDQGDLEGMVISEIQERHNGFWKVWRDRPGDARVPGGESLPELQARAWAAVEEIRDRHPEEMVVAVSHNLTITTLLCRVLGLDLNAMRRIRQHNATINLIEYDPARDWTIVTMNALAHLNGGITSEEKPYL